MPEYRLYHVGRSNVRAETIIAASDSEAIEKAAQRVDGQTAELWLDWRKLKTFNA
jgi:hypothetical protein